LWKDLFGENILDREDFIEKLELLLGDFLVEIVNRLPVKLRDVLESVYYERL
jgi:hypothetical protein